MSRLGTTVTCTLLLVYKRIIVLVMLAAIMTAGGAIINKSLPGFGPMLGIITDSIASVFIFLTGMKFYESHTSFCIINNVSFKHRIISGAISAFTVSTVTAVLCTASRIIVFGADGYSFTLPDMVRTAIKTAVFIPSSPIIDGIEMLFFILAVFLFGYFVSAVSQRIGNGKLLLILLITAVILCGNIAIAAFTGVNILSWLMIPAAFMQNSRFTAILLSIIFSAIFGFFGVIIKTDKVNAE